MIGGVPQTISKVIQIIPDSETETGWWANAWAGGGGCSYLRCSGAESLRGPRTRSGTAEGPSGGEKRREGRSRQRTASSKARGSEHSESLKDTQKARVAGEQWARAGGQEGGEARGRQGWLHGALVWAERGVWAF